MKKSICIVICILFLFTGCTQSADKVIKNYSTAIDNFDWVSSDNKPLLYENMFANEYRIFLADINNDLIPEIILTEIYSPREANYSEVFSLKAKKLVSMGGFWGDAFLENDNVIVYKNQENKKVFLTTVYSSHGGDTNEILLEINVQDLTSKVKGIAVYDYNSGENIVKQSYWIDNQIKVDRDFIDYNFEESSFESIDKIDYDNKYNDYISTLTEQYNIAIYESGFGSVGNFPTSDMYEQVEFDFDNYLAHREDLESIAKTNNKISKKVKEKLNFLMQPK